MEQIDVTKNVDAMITGLRQEILSKSSNSVPLEQLTESEIVFLQRYPTLDKFYKAFGPDSWRYALEHVDKAVNTVVPSLNRLNLIYNTKDADVALFVKHFLGYYLMVERSGKELGKDVCTNVAAIFLGRNGAECTPVGGAVRWLSMATPQRRLRLMTSNHAVLLLLNSMYVNG